MRELNYESILTDVNLTSLFAGASYHLQIPMTSVIIVFVFHGKYVE